MGKLYDRRDLEWELGYIDRLEREYHIAVANGQIPAMSLGEINISTKWGVGRYGREKQPVTVFDKERQRAKMRLLRTGQLISDFSHAKRVTKACGGCYTDSSGKVKACERHKALWRQATLNLKFAAEENEARRVALGQPARNEDAPHDSRCNVWERWYFEDKRDGVWPGRTPEQLAYNKEQFERLDYRGWLNMMRYDAEEMSEEEFRSELRRLGGA